VPRISSEEASLKYFLLGAFSSGIVVYGIALVYGATGMTGFKAISDVIAANTYDVSLLLVGAALILVGLGFKVAVVPFHMWTPDVYHGAPSSVSAFMAVGAKAAGFAALLRFFVLVLPSLVAGLNTGFMGNLGIDDDPGERGRYRPEQYQAAAGVFEHRPCRVHHDGAGPIRPGDVAAQSVASALFYLVAYAFTSFAAWAVVIAVERSGDQGTRLEDFAGLGRRHPGLAAVMAVAMLSFTGVPPTLGFFGKFYLFSTVIDGGFIGLALIGVLTSLVSAFYYLRVIVIMYMRDGEPVVHREFWLYLTATAAAVGTVLLSIFSTPLLNWASQAVLLFL